jgi:hypothetical protein
MSNQGDLSNKAIDDLTPVEKGMLLASVGSHKLQRPIDPITIAEIFSNSQSNALIAKKTGISARMVGMFKSLLSLSDETKASVRSGRISIDKAVRLAALGDTKAQELLNKAILADPRIFSAPNVSRVVSLKNRNPDMSVEECINRVLKAKPLIENRYVLVTDLRGELSELSKKRAAKEGTPYEQFLKEVTRRSLPEGSLHSLVVHHDVVLLILTSEGWQALRYKALEFGVPLEEVLDHLIEQAL